jgi:ubiquinone/menaquinone biosynthesis C-methylase UbiE
MTKGKKLPDYYDDPKYNYFDYWQKRNYEDGSEKIALNKFFTKIPKTEIIIDLGGGFGRMAPIYNKKAKHCLLIDPSKKMIGKARTFCRQLTNVKTKKGCLTEIPVKDNYADIVLIVRTLHHCPNLKLAFKEVNRILKPGGFLILEFANKAHFKNIFRSFSHLKLDCFENQPKNITKKKQVPFYNFHPSYIKKTLGHNGFTIKRQLSVSNFRNSFLKKLLPLSFLLKFESWLQKPLSKIYFGPSIFLLTQKENPSLK